MFKDGTQLPEQTQFDGADADETLTQEEVTAILKRYGEMQGGESAPHVSDVAEALQVDRSVVARMLKDIRTADTEKQLRDRLDKLEAEHADLKLRAQTSDFDAANMFEMGHWTYRRDRRRRKGIIFAAVIATLAASAFGQAGFHASFSPTMAMFVMLAVAFAVKFARRRKLR